VPDSPKRKSKQKPAPSKKATSRASQKRKAATTAPKPEVDDRWSDRQSGRLDPRLIKSVTESPEARWAASQRSGAANVIVQARGVSKVYKSGLAQIFALNSVDLELSRGEMVAVMGPSGSGKTTLLNCLSGLDEVTYGEVVVEGVSLARMSDAARTEYRSKRMGFVFQAFNLLPVFSSVENVELPLLLAGVRASKSRQRAREALNAVGLSAREKHRPSELSAGEQQRVAIARAIAPDPAVLWADEPTGNLDTENAQRIMQMIKHLNSERGLTILLVTHDHQMAAWAEQKLQMRDGRVIG
jgi:putative ABC transport system ATP-binding protein